MRKYFQGLGRTKWGIGKNKQTNKQKTEVTPIASFPLSSVENEKDLFSISGSMISSKPSGEVPS